MATVGDDSAIGFPVSCVSGPAVQRRTKLEPVSAGSASAVVANAVLANAVLANAVLANAVVTGWRATSRVTAGPRMATAHRDLDDWRNVR